MNSNMVIVVVVQIMFACTTLNCQAAPDRGKASDQLRNRNRELSLECPNRRDTLGAEDNRQVWIRGQCRMLTMFRQNDLLQELLPLRDRSPVVIKMKKEKKAVQRISYKIATQERGILEELLAEASLP